MIFIRFDAGNDKYGNPRRAIVVFNESGTINRVFNEGYSGLTEVRSWFPDHRDGGTFRTTVREYRNLLKGRYT